MASDFYFNLKGAKIYQAIKYGKTPIFKFAQTGQRLFLIFFLFSLLLFLFGILSEKLPESLNPRLFGLSIIFLVLSLFFWYSQIFFESKLKKPEIKTGLAKVIANPEKYNLAEFLSFEIAQAAWSSLRFAILRKIPEVNSTILFYFLLDNPKLHFIFTRLVLDLAIIRKLVRNYVFEIKPEITTERRKRYSPDFQKTILDGLKIALKRGHHQVEFGDIITALADNEPVFQKILFDAKVKKEDIENLILWQEHFEQRIIRRKKFWEYENLLRLGTLAKDWLAGYTITLDKFSIDWTRVVKKKSLEVIGHKKELEEIERILAHQEINNVLLVGEPGTGRKSIISALAQKSLSGQSLPAVNYKRIVELDMPRLISQMANFDALALTLDRICQEVVLAGNVILVIDEFHNYVSETTYYISPILARYLHLPQFQLIAITTFEGLHRNIEQNPSILLLFGKVEVSEISSQETLLLLENLTFALEKKYHKLVSYPALKDIIFLTERYLPNLPFPEKAIEILDEVVIYVAGSTEDRIVMPSHVAKIMTEKTEIPIGEIETKEREVLLNLENLIHRRIINQEQAVDEISIALRRARAEVATRKGPIGTFLFLGPTGVGKTETAKALAENYFGSEEKMIRLDMSEFQEIKDISRLIGAPGQEGLLTTPVRENPFSLILLDEIEKAHSNILNLFLQVLDEGHLTDGQGRKVDFKNSIIIATSNAGYQVILDALKEKIEWSEVKQKLLDFLFAEGIFRPEFINRFDGVVIFKPLSKENLLDISELLLQKLKQNLKEKGIEFVISLPLKEKIVEIGYDPVFGARQMRRAIQDRVESVLAKAILEGKLKRGDRVKVNPEDFSLEINF